MSLIRISCFLPLIGLLFLEGIPQDDLADLRRDFDHPLPGTRLLAAKAVAKHGAKAIPLLEDALREGSARARRAATDAAIAMRLLAEPLHDSLCDRLADNLPWVRAGAAEALGVIGPLPDKTIASLVKLASDPDLFVRISTMQVLAKRRITNNKRLLLLAAVAALEMRDSGWAAKRFSIELLRRHGKQHQKAIPHLLAVLRDSPEGMWDQSENIARLLIGMEKTDQVLKILAERLGRPERGGFKSSLRVVGRLGNLADSLRPLVSEIARTSKNRDHRMVAKQTLDLLSGK